MTQARLAAGSFTSGFISLVETGRTRMSLRAAEMVAAKLGVSIADLLTPAAKASGSQVELLLIQAEAALRAGDGSQALRLADDLQARATGEHRARVQRL